MAYNEQLAERIRAVFMKRKGVTEKKMFGGLTFLLRGHMCCGIADDDLVLRLGTAQGEQAVKKAHVRVCDFTGRPMKGMVLVGPGGYTTDRALQHWVQQAADFVSSLPAKKGS